METIDVSVLLSIYHKEQVDYFIKAMESILVQTKQPEEIFLVADGPLTEVLDEAISEYKEKLNDRLTIFRLDENKGLGIALAEGVIRCRNPYIARMDTDDIMDPQRLEIQYHTFLNNTDLAIVGSNIIEFESEITNVLGERHVPEKNEEIRNFSKRRNPFNHMTVMFKKEAILKVGNYKTLNGFEDYYLWVRLLKAGFKANNIQKNLVYARAGKEMYYRRGGRKYLISGIKARKVIYQEGLGKLSDFLFVTIAHTMVSIMPNKMRGYFYQKKLRN